LKQTHTHSALRLLPLAVLLMLIAFACSKKPERIGENLQPDQNLIQLLQTDTTTIVAYSQLEDTIRTDEPARALFGSLKDPVFGTTKAGFYTQTRLSTNGHNFGEDPQLDSLVLQLAYDGYYGDTNTLQTMRVYELLDDIFIDSAYFSASERNVSELDYANFSFTPAPRTPFVSGDDTLSPAIRIRLSDVSTALGEKILNASETDLESADDFKAYFKGLYVMAESVGSDGAILYFNLTTNLSRLTIYYNNETDDSLRYDFFITSSEARYNFFDHNNYADADPAFQNQVLNNDTLAGRNLLYTQAMAGVKTKIHFPNLKNLSSDGKQIVINEAKLLFRSTEDTLLTPPSQMALVKDKGDGTYAVLPDQLEGEAFFGGKFKSSVNGYEFRLTRYVQDLLLNPDATDDYGLYFFVLGASAKADRWVFNGTQPESDTLQRFKLQLVYSIVNE